MNKYKREQKCSFCGKEPHEVEQLLAGPEAFICNECLEAGQLQLRMSRQGKPLGKPDARLSRPKEIKGFLDDYVIGQESAKKRLSVAVYNHYKRIVTPRKALGGPEVELSKSNILLLGPTGTGKTLLAQTLARFLDVPLAMADATTLTEAGYVGEDVENILTKLLQAANYDVERAQRGIVFIDEIDKVCRRGEATGGADVSREGVQRDLLPLIEGSTVSTKYGMVKTDHILFIASGAFHLARPSDLIPELQGRLPIRVELDALSPDDFERILTEPHFSLTQQYQALLAAEGLVVEFTPDCVRRIAEVAWQVNERTENIGARRLHTVVEKLLDEISFEGPDLFEKVVTIDEAYVTKMLADIVKNEDLSRYIL